MSHGHAVGALQVARSTSDVSELWDVQTKTLLIFIPIAAAAGIAGAFFLTGRALKPIVKLTQAASEIGSQNLTRRLEIDGDDELALLALQFNGMLGRLDTAFSQLESAYEQQRRFTADASHELRTPLARMMLTASEAVQGNGSREEMIDSLKVCLAAGHEMAELVEQLLTLARADAGRLEFRQEPTDLRVLMAEAVDEFSERRIELEVPDEPLMANVESGYLRRALRNLLANAIRHTSSPKRVRLIGQNEGDHVVLIVSDDGEGIAPEHLSHLGERFYRVDSSRSVASGGTGLGLAIVRAVLAGHGGQMTIQSRLGVGTQIQLKLPRTCSTTCSVQAPANEACRDGSENAL
jgi:signal transduction histidine kinase